MKNIVVIFGLALFGLCMVASVLADDLEPPVFIDPPREISGSYCDDSLSYQFRAIIPNRPNEQGRVRYRIHEGPGQINEQTGFWVLKPEDLTQSPYYILRIGAYVTNSDIISDPNTDPKIWGFFGMNDPVIYMDQIPMKGGVPVYKLTTPIDTNFIVTLDDPDWCEESTIRIIEIIGTPQGTIDLTDSLLRVHLLSADQGGRFIVTFEAVSGQDTIRRQVIFETRAQVIPVFVSCPDTIQSEFCEFAQFQVLAVDPDFPDNSVGIYYNLLSRIGHINRRTGLWSYRPRPEEAGTTFEVVVEAFYGRDRTSADQNCRFVVVVGDKPALTYTDPLCGTEIMVQPLDTFSYRFESYSSDSCNRPLFFLDTISEQPDGAMWFMRGSYFRFIPTLNDAGKSFDVRIGMTDRVDTVYCDFTFKVEPASLLEVSIDKKGSMYRGPRRTIDIDLKSTNVKISGFDLLLDYDATAFNLIEVIPGSALFGDSDRDDCQWEYFSYHTETTDSGSYGPRRLLRVVGIVDDDNHDDENDEDHDDDGDDKDDEPCDDSLPSPTTLFSLDMQLSDSCIYDCQYYPIRFFWNDCGDNAFSTKDGNISLLSRSISEFEGGDITNTNYGWPTYFGAQAECYDTNSSIGGIAAIDYMNGGIDVVCLDDLPAPGDCNRDSTQFSERDLELIVRAFVKPFEGCAGCGDVNSDGIPNRIDDLQTFLNRMNHDTCSSIENASATFSVDVASGTVSVATNEQLGATQFVFDGHIVASSPPVGMLLEQHYDSTVTRVLIYSFESASYDSGSVITFTGNANLIDVETATRCGDYIDATINNEPLDPIRISIEKTRNSVQGQHEFVDIVWEEGSNEIGGFYLQIGYDASALILQTVTPGSSLFGDSTDPGCGWEYFTYKYMYPCDSCPSGVLKIIGMAKNRDGNDNSNCYKLESLPSTLFTIDFLVADNQEYSCQFVPLSFLWIDCHENTLWPVSVDSIYLSKQIIDSDGNDITDPSSGWPTYTGAQAECDSTFRPGRPLPHRLVEFVNGGIDISCPNQGGQTGDLNLNGIPHEVADVVLYANYFVHGDAVFTIDYDEQVRQSDVNKDGVPLTIEDLVYLIRIVVGDALPYPRPTISTDTVNVIDYSGELYAQFNSTDSIGAAYLIFEGQIQTTLPPYLDSIGFQSKQFYDPVGNFTRVLVYGIGQGLSFKNNVFLIYTGNGTLSYVDVATYMGGAVETIIDIVTDVDGDNTKPLPTTFALHQNYPNPFNLSTMISFDLPNSSSVRLTIYNNLGQSLFERVAGFTAGTHTIEWDGSDRAGNTVASGIYYYRIEADSFTETRKMLLLK